MMKHEIGLTLLRIMLGITLFVHGLVKFQGGIGNVAGWFQSIGLPGSLAYIVACVELVGGIFLILGLFTRVVAALGVVIMIGAIIFAHLSSGFLGGYELNLLVMVIAFYLALCGSRFLALDALRARKY
ncbi:putative membrane protein YphA (DoxX/SURF4 family) [Pullulanibacillus pueri]|uniref:DoxX family protein n=1 Tax=Pullulanibacillus pueri TaxID=1437324 RepID=A0A8J2ZWG6_9BACL|nr:DoxX family protein [Pullulanibacillus pueri]MBM7682625.1 putative membrane protein YphA (DoxX/SURF4 family) [Pullulanibacillus pueri]GGH82557.1 hypothetical protein GCM10007096_22120 [Pullulanibacillus pueri]